VRFLRRFPVVHLHPKLPLLHAQHHRLPAHPAYHVKRFLRRTVQRQRLRVLLDPRLDHLPQFLLDLEKPVRRA
jgi:hypothetical protein